MSFAADVVQRIVTFAKHDGISACSYGNSRFQRLIRCFSALAYIFVAIIAIYSINIDRPAST